MTVQLHINAKGCNRISSTKTQFELRVVVAVFLVRDAIRNNSPYSFFRCRKNNLCQEVFYIYDFVYVVGFVGAHLVCDGWLLQRDVGFVRRFALCARSLR